MQTPFPTRCLAALSALGALSCSAPAPPAVETTPDSAALAGIERLHAADQRNVMARDGAGLLDLWSDDPVALPPTGPNVVGRDGIASMLAPMSETPDSTRKWTTVDYTQHFDEVYVIPDGGGGAARWAWDLGTARTVLQNRESGRRIAVTAKLLRILERDDSGAWKVHRSMWTPGETEELGEDGR